MSEPIIITGKAFLDIPPSEAFPLLLEPSEQVKWNTLYLEVHTEPPGHIRNGTVMTGRFKGSGKAQVTFENVIPVQEFTHYSRLKLFNLIYLGEFRHNYKMTPHGQGSEFTQTVTFEARGFGRLLKKVIVDGFRKRLPESFVEFKAFTHAAKSVGRGVSRA